MPHPRRRGLAALLVLAGPLLGGPALALDPPQPGLRLLFADEFDGTSLGPAWRTRFQSGERRLTKESQVYLDPDDPARTVAVEDGRLVLTAKPIAAPVPGYPDAAYVSGMVSSHEALRPFYGYVEARIRIPAGRGIWPAFWLFRSDGTSPYGEIDVLESLGHEPDKVYATLHSGRQHEGRLIQQSEAKAERFGATSFADDYHVYAVDWGPERTRFLIDGKVIGEHATRAALRAPMHLMLNLAVGGEWAGPPDATTPFPARMEVDWVRVWGEDEGEGVYPSADPKD